MLNKFKYLLENSGELLSALKGDPAALDPYK